MLELQNLHISRSSITIPLMIGFCILLAFILIGSKFGAQKAHACVEYPIQGSTTIYSSPLGSGYTVNFSLWYDTCTSSNFTSSNVTSGSDSNHLHARVCRNAGNGLPFLCATSTTCNSTGVCNSPEVYSPINTAFAESYDNNYSVQTASF